VLTDLEKTNKELDQFAYIVSHDLKAPLRAINNLSEWIMEDMPEMPLIYLVTLSYCGVELCVWKI
jgi:light-regulated signal transduction histidine kinase (bacteriophytochrome)